MTSQEKIERHYYNGNEKVITITIGERVLKETEKVLLGIAEYHLQEDNMEGFNDIHAVLREFRIAQKRAHEIERLELEMQTDEYMRNQEEKKKDKEARRLRKNAREKERRRRKKMEMSNETA